LGHDLGTALRYRSHFDTSRYQSTISATWVTYSKRSSEVFAIHEVHEPVFVGNAA